jgi:S1-C subfamily serine protease
MKDNKKTLRFKAVYVLLLVGSFVMVLLSLLSIVSGNKVYLQFMHLLEQSSSGLGAAAVSQPQPSENLTSSSSSSSPTSQSTTFTSSLPDVFQKVENSVVQVTSKTPVNNTINSQAQNATALGSGFVYDNQGHIITNDHVVGGSKIVDITFIDGNSILQLISMEYITANTIL